jgi:hypothetical protein
MVFMKFSIAAPMFGIAFFTKGNGTWGMLFLAMLYCFRESKLMLNIPGAA